MKRANSHTVATQAQSAGATGVRVNPRGDESMLSEYEQRQRRSFREANARELGRSGIELLGENWLSYEREAHAAGIRERSQ